VATPGAESAVYDCRVLSCEQFDRAILESGTANMPWATTSQAEAQRRSLELAFDYLHCPRTTNMSEVTSLDIRGGAGKEFCRVPDPGTRPLLPGRIRVVPGSGKKYPDPGI